MTQPTHLHPNLFCPQCQNYLGAQPNCDCGYHRPQIIPAAGEARWQIDLGSDSYTRPLITAEHIFVGTRAGCELIAIQRSDGIIVWRQKLPAKIYSSPASYRQNIIIGCNDGTIYAHNINTHKPVWHYKIGEKVQGDIRVEKGIAYAGNNSGEVVALNAQNGARLWQRSLPNPRPVKGVPLLHQGLLFVGGYDRHLYALDAQNGKSQWSFDSGDQIAASPIIAGKKIIVANLSGQVMALTLSGGRPQWDNPVNLDGGVRGTPIFHQGQLYFGTLKGRVYALDAESGKTLWRVDTPNAVAVSPALAHDILYIGDNSGTVTALNIENGEQFWQFQADSTITAAPTIAENDDTVYVGTKKGTLYALPWHLGQWSALSARYDKTDEKEIAAIYYALAGDASFDDDEMKSHYQSAQNIWRKTPRPGRAARLLEWTLAFPNEIAIEYEKAARLLKGKNRPLAAAYFAEAAHHHAEARNQERAEQCQIMQSKLTHLPRLQIEMVNLPPFETGVPGNITFDVFNFGKSSAYNTTVRLAGSLAKSIKFPLDTIPANGRIELEADDITPLGEILRVDLFFTDQSGQTARHNYIEEPLIVTPIDADIVVDGDTGATILRLKEGAPMPKVRIRGDAGLIKVVIE